MIGFGPKTVTGVVVPDGGTVSQDVALAAEAVQLAEISVSAASERGTVNRALEEQRNAVNIVNSVSAEQIAKSPDSDAGQAIQRVSGVTVQDGKYVFVRGLGERYTTTSLNGTRIPSPEPERKVVPLDLFPASPAGGDYHLENLHPRAAGRFQRRAGGREDPRVSGPAGGQLLGVGRRQQRGHRPEPGEGADRRHRVAGLCRQRAAAAHQREATRAISAASPCRR